MLKVFRNLHWGQGDTFVLSKHIIWKGITNQALTSGHACCLDQCALMVACKKPICQQKNEEHAGINYTSIGNAGCSHIVSADCIQVLSTFLTQGQMQGTYNTAVAMLSTCAQAACPSTVHELPVIMRATHCQSASDRIRMKV